jgi:hypothetical protein
LTAEEVLRLVVMPDEQGRYHFDEMGYESLPEYPGYLVGYRAVRLPPLKQRITGTSKPNQNIFVAAYQRRRTRDRDSSIPLSKELQEEHRGWLVVSGDREWNAHAPLLLKERDEPDHHSQTEAHRDARAGASLTHNATGLS